METPIGNDGGRTRCAAFTTRNIRRISVGFRGFRGGNRGKIWTSMEEAWSSKEGCGKSRKGDSAHCYSIGRVKKCKIRLTEFSILYTASSTREASIAIQQAGRTVSKVRY